MDSRVVCILLISSHTLTIANTQLDEAESCPAPAPAPTPAPTPVPAPAPAPEKPSAPTDVSTSVCLDLPGSSEDWMRVLKQLKILLKQLRQVRQLIGTKHFVSELLTTLKVPGAKEQWMKLLQDISLEEILDSITFGGGYFNLFDNLFI